MQGQKIECPLGRGMDNPVKHQKSKNTRKGGYNKGIVTCKSKSPRIILKKKAKTA